MNRLFVTLLVLVLAGVVITACSKTVAPSETPEPTKEPTAAATTTRPAAPTATETPTPTAPPTPEPRKQVLIQYGWTGGDGTRDIAYYLGWVAPNFVVYVDGQLLIREGVAGAPSPEEYEEFPEIHGEGFTYTETRLSEAEVCDLLAQIGEAGLFEIEEDTRNYFLEPSPLLYAFDTEDPGSPPGPISDGAPDPIIVVNGDPTAYVVIYSYWLDYLQPETAAVYNLLDAYDSPDLVPYDADRALLYIGRGAELLSADEIETMALWPAGLPPLADLYAGADELFGGGRHIVVRGESVPTIHALFDRRMRGQRFSDGEYGYLVIARPMLPHETAEDFSNGHYRTYPYEAESFPLPFDCEE